VSAGPAPEFSRLVDLRQIVAAPVTLTATEAERAALAARFALVSVESLEATVTLQADGDRVTAKGRMKARWTQPCAISGEDLPQHTDEALALVFVPDTATWNPDEEIELDDSDLDEIPYTGTTFDLGEALAQTLALAIDPFAEGPHADRARKTAGIVSEDASGPLAAALASLVKKD
jgi:uncharacterized metal-binding protein YceD (DUF177 family)